MAGGTRLLTGADGQRYSFDPGSFSLELLLTGGPGGYARHEILHMPTDLAAWLPDSRLAAVAPLPVESLRIKPAELRAIKEFRDTLWSVATALARGKCPSAEEFEVLNDSAVPGPRPRVEPTSGRREWAIPVTGAQILGAAAREAIDMVTGDLRDRIRECAASDCYLIFVDTSRPGRRRWCSMERCGNRNKVHAYRTRQIQPD
ncbi:CGNR zinc finger domain-containing protein [Actinomadura barringtoniae]|uniref:CGNR zinc finger domain-containing protein n=1 Tax=Actinomadura barringtoniae TaxID=1427535 RepID=A0A939T8Q8_9ACTN|nr:CGNR zinc finger domain-containing protein [Actinomadura barringtoniae]MBO2454418.1 CGNR zinc finger domain-containing protein [Actinomadura barringtoniae]